MTGELDVSGGRGGIGADCDDMRATADALGRTKGTIGDIAGDARGAAFSGALARTAIFSPISAAQAEASLVQAAAVVSGFTLRLEALVLVLRTRANLFELADAGRFVLDKIVSTAVAPLIVPLALLALVNRDAAMRIVSAFPGLTDLVAGGVANWIVLLGGGRPGLPTSFEGVVGMIQGIAGIGGAWQDGPLTTPRRDGLPTSTRIGGIQALIGSVGQLGSGPSAPDDRGAIRIVRVNGPGGETSWIVEFPGTDFEGGSGDPMDMGTNLTLMEQRRAELLRAALSAMEDQNIGSGDRIMVTGHSQGGIAAMALASDPAARRRYNITNVVTAGSPVSRFHPPADVHVLSIEHAQDPVPRVDTQPNPDRANWTTVTRDVGDSPGVAGNPIEAHHATLYTETAGMIDDDPELADVRGDLAPFLGNGTSQDYVVQRRH